MKILRKIPAFILLIMLLVSSVKESIFADESVFIHRPEELPSYYMNPRELATKTDEITRPIADTTEDVSIMSLMSDHSVYASKNTVVNESVLSSNLDAPDAMMTHFSLQKSARMRNTVV